jgi:alpha-D-ribose 1-methylphosphonate 5-triphosphate diphosphatase PhnM
MKPCPRRSGRLSTAVRHRYRAGGVATSYRRFTAEAIQGAASRGERRCEHRTRFRCDVGELCAEESEKG